MRLFVAVNLPATEKERLGTLLDELRRAKLPVRWVEQDSLHVTLKFLGEVDDQRRAAVGTAMSQAALGTVPFDIGIDGLGSFPPRGRPRVIYIDVDAPASLAELRERLEQRIEPLGFPRENLRFNPHITVGRVAAGSGSFDRAAMDRIAHSFVYNAIVHVTSVELMRSHLGPRGARYEMIERAPLGSTGE